MTCGFDHAVTPVPFLPQGKASCAPGTGVKDHSSGVSTTLCVTGTWHSYPGDRRSRSGAGSQWGRGPKRKQDGVSLTEWIWLVPFLWREVIWCPALGVHGGGRGEGHCQERPWAGGQSKLELLLDSSPYPPGGECWAQQEVVTREVPWKEDPAHSTGREREGRLRLRESCWEGRVGADQRSRRATGSADSPPATRKRTGGRAGAPGCEEARWHLLGCRGGEAHSAP